MSAIAILLLALAICALAASVEKAANAVAAAIRERK